MSELALLASCVQSGDVHPAIQALAGALASTQLLQCLELSAGAFFALPSGELVPVALLCTASGRQLLAKHCDGVQVQLATDEAGPDWVRMTWPLPIHGAAAIQSPAAKRP